MYLRAALANDDGARGNRFPAVGLHPEPLGLRIATIARAAACFFVCHEYLPRFALSESSLADDAVDFQLGVALSMTLMFLIMLAPAHLEDGDFVATPVREDGRRDTCAGNHGLSQTHAGPVADHQYLIENHFRAHLGGYLFDLEFFAGGNLVLLAAGLYDRVHRKLQKRLREKRPLF